MEQRTKIEAMIKEDEELRKRLNQTEETLEKMRETNKQLEHSLQTEVCMLGVKSNVRLNRFTNVTFLSILPKKKDAKNSGFAFLLSY